MTKLFAIVAWTLASTQVSGANHFPCKYSVRDVAFVNVHGKPWQLQLIKPEEIDEQTFLEWNHSLRARLKESNVGHVWLESSSEEATRLRSTGPPGSGLPPMGLVGSGGTLIPVSSQTAASFEDSLDSILNSPAREEILDQVVDSLCVFVLVESGNKKLDAQARSTVVAAVEQMEKQIWTLEKPADKGPALVRISNEARASEYWLLQSAGIEQSNLPAVAIMYGQGRRLGEILVGDDINLKTLVGRASVCGQDCECDLDSDWLYGGQMIHVWSKQRERATESSLTFDPNSAFVIAEVAQIIRKNAGRTLGQAPGQSQLDLGGGLIIHDLDQDSTSTQLEARDSQDQSIEHSVSDDSSIENRPEGDQSSHSWSPSSPESAFPISIPWMLLVGLAIVTVAVFLIRLVKW